MKNRVVKIIDKSNKGGKVWAWVTVGGATTVGVMASNWQAIMQLLATVFGIK